jgi:hypothetical protein
MQPNALLAWQSFYDAKVGVTYLRPLKESHPRDSDVLGKNLWVVCSEFFFMLPSSFVFGVVTPLHFAHLDDFIVSHSLYGIQNSEGPLAVH